MEGNGHMRFGSGAFDGAYDFRSRFGEGAGTNPEELLGAAHAGCFSMALSGILSRAGHTPQSIRTTAPEEPVENHLDHPRPARKAQRNDSMKLLISVLKSPFFCRRSSIFRIEWMTVE